MPVWSMRLQRSALIHLVAGATLGAVLLAARGTGLVLPYGRLMAAHGELLLVGWLLQFTMGVAYWMLPKHAAGDSRGTTGPIATAWLLLNGGVLMAVVGQAMEGPPGMVAAGRFVEAGALAAFAANVWPRIKPFGAGR